MGLAADRPTSSLGGRPPPLLRGEAPPCTALLCLANRNTGHLGIFDCLGHLSTNTIICPAFEVQISLAVLYFVWRPNAHLGPGCSLRSMCWVLRGAQASGRAGLWHLGTHLWLPQFCVMWRVDSPRCQHRAGFCRHRTEGRSSPMLAGLEVPSSNGGVLPGAEVTGFGGEVGRRWALGREGRGRHSLQQEAGCVCRSFGHV